MNDPDWCIKRKYRVNLEVFVKQDKLKEDFAYIPIRCEGINWESFLPDKENRVDIDSLGVVRHDPDTGKPVIFDEEAEEEKQFIIPHRFDPDHKPFALSFDSDKGDLTWLAPFLPKKQYYSIYFDLEKNEKKIPEYNGLIGDGDIFTQKNGRLSVHGNSRPVLYGDKLFGKKGIVIGSSYETGIYFFEEVDLADSTPNFINQGRLKDNKGGIIYGIPAFHDLDKNGILDLVVGRNDGTLHRYKNTGSNEKPVFTGPEPLREIDGHQIDLKKYLSDKDVVVQLADGTISKRYPKMPIIQTHGGETHIYTMPKFVDWTGNGRYDLLVGTKGGFLLHFEFTESGYKEGVFLKDEKGKIIRCEPINAFPAVFDWNGDGKLDLLVGSSHGFLYYLRNAGMTDGVPVFRNKGKIKIEKETGRSFPLVTDFHNRLSLLIGNSHGEVKHYTKLDTAKTGEPILDDGEYIRMNNAWINQQMPVSRYVDMDGDGRKDFLSGDIRGGIFLYKNLGTNRNPIFSKRYQLNDEDGPIKIEGGPDPLEVDDGYSKPVIADITGDGKPDILVGTGLGRIYFYRNLGLNKEGIPEFARGKVLKDSEGNEIRCHHMSAVEAADWDGDGILDLIVGGQKSVHNMKDDDLDESQLRWYHGLGRDKTGLLRFASYIPLEAEGDKEIGYRPIPPIVGEWEREKVLHIGAGMMFRQIDKNAPQKIEFLRNFPPRLIRANERFIGAYPTFSFLGENDPLIVHGSCVSSIFAFRRSFVLNKGYLKADFNLTSIRKADGSMQESLNLAHLRSESVGVGLAPTRATARVAPTKEHTISFIPDIPKAGLKINSDFWQNVPSHTDFLDSNGNNVPAKQKIELKIVYSQDSLILQAEFNEPLMDRLICNINHNNGPITNDDHVSVLIDPDIKSDTYYCWLINPLGYYKEFNIERATREPVGPWRIGSKEKVDIQTQRDKKSYSLQMCIPFKKVGFIPKKGDSLLFDLSRRRNLYSNNIQAREQQLTEFFAWSGNKTGWVKLKKGNNLK